MPRPFLLALLLGAAAAAAQGVFPAAAAPPASAGGGAPVRIRIDSPRSGEPVQNKVHLAPIRGSAEAEGQSSGDFDVMVVIDVSESTECASGVDVNHNGVVGFDPHTELVPPGTYPEDVCSTDPGDSIFAAEITAARSLIQSLDPKRVRVGILTFSGDVDPVTGEQARPGQKDAWLDLPLTNDFARAYNVLAGVYARGPHGATDFAAGIRLAITELSALTGSQSPPRPNARKIMLFLTDGIPTFPIGKGIVMDPGDIDAALNAARLAHTAGITINTYGLGPEALADQRTVTEMARITLGTYTPVKNPGDIVAILQGVSFANIEDVVVTNLTTGDFSTDVRLLPDGSFTGFVPVKEGKNRVRVTALATDGSRGSVELDLTFKVAELSDRELALELERIRDRNKELQLLLERKRIEEFRESEKQRKELEVRPDGAANP
jgi:von Willebrand factor type A domain-containing protein